MQMQSDMDQMLYNTPLQNANQQLTGALIYDQVALPWIPQFWRNIDLNNKDGFLCSAWLGAS